MTIIELLLLRLRDDISPTDPTLVQNLSTVRSLIHTKSRFYQCIEDARLVYVLGQWPTLAAHQEFLSSSADKDDILSHQTHQLDLVWMLHLDLPAGVSRMADAVPFAAPVLSIARMSFSTVASGGMHVDAYKAIMAEHRSDIADTTRPYPVFDGWRIDADEGKAECVVLTGWESVDAHAEFTKSMREASRGYASARDYVEEMEVRHARDMEA